MRNSITNGPQKVSDTWAWVLLKDEDSYQKDSHYKFSVKGIPLVYILEQCTKIHGVAFSWDLEAFVLCR